MIHSSSINETLYFGEFFTNFSTLTSNIDILLFTQTLSVSPSYYSLDQTLAFSEEQTIFNNNPLLEDTLSFSESLAFIRQLRVDQSLSFTEYLDDFPPYALTQSFRLDEFFAYSVFPIHLIEDALSLNQTYSLYVLRSGLAPQSYTSLPLYSDPASFMLAADLTLAQSCVTSYPTLLLESAFGSLLLPAPVKGNKDGVKQARIQRSSLNGTLTIARPPYWPKSRLLSYEFDNLDDPTRTALLAFMRLNAGLMITITDHENVEHTNCIVTTGNIKVSHLRNCLHRTSFEVERFP